MRAGSACTWSPSSSLRWSYQMRRRLRRRSPSSAPARALSSNFCPRSRLSFWSREEGSAFPPRVGSPILHARAESGAYSRAPLLLPAFRDGAAAVCLPLPLVRTVWLVGLAEVAPPTPSNALLVDHIRSHELRSTSACSPSRSLALSSLP